MKSFTEYLTEQHEYSNVQAPLRGDVAARLIDFAKLLPDDEIYVNSSMNIPGRELDSHITVLYGIHGTDPHPTYELLAGKGPFNITLGKTSMFDTQPTHDVLKVSIENSTGLHVLHNLIKEKIPCTLTHPTYIPHITIAYMQKGAAKKYINDKRFFGQQILINRLQFSTKGERKTDIQL